MRVTHLDHDIRPGDPGVKLKVAAEIGPLMRVQIGAATWTVKRVTRYWDDRAGREMVSAVGNGPKGQPFSFCKKATDAVRVVAQ